MPSLSFGEMKMTSGSFHLLPTDNIRIERDERQRRELVEIDILADSLRRVGLINPLVVTRDNILVAGERRLTAARSLGWTSIAVQYTDELDLHALRAIELEENVKRVDLDWRDQCRAIFEYHNLRKEEAGTWSLNDTAEALGLTSAEVSHKTRIAVAIAQGNERVINAPKYSVARGILERDAARADEQDFQAIHSAVLSTSAKAAAPGVDAPTRVHSHQPANDTAPTGAAVAQPEPESYSIINSDFTSWAPAYSGAKFNFIHCDFPYGINADSFNQGGAAAHGGYRDSEDTYWTLLQALASNLDRIAAPSCQLIFWYSMKFHQATLDFFAKETDFVIDPFPLIWLKSDNAGILPDPSRGPRRIYETALWGHRGDRKVVQAVANAYAAPTIRERHMSEKPEPVLRHFYRMAVDHHSLVLDPTAGSGSAIRVAESMGAKYALGLEVNPEFAQRAQSALVSARKLRKAAS